MESHFTDVLFLLFSGFNEAYIQICFFESIMQRTREETADLNGEAHLFEEVLL